MGDRATTKPPCVFAISDPTLSTSIDDIKNTKIKDSGKEDNNLTKDGLFSDNSYQLINLPISVAWMHQCLRPKIQ